MKSLLPDHQLVLVSVENLLDHSLDADGLALANTDHLLLDADQVQEVFVKQARSALELIQLALQASDRDFSLLDLGCRLIGAKQALLPPLIQVFRLTQFLLVELQLPDFDVEDSLVAKIMAPLVALYVHLLDFFGNPRADLWRWDSKRTRFKVMPQTDLPLVLSVRVLVVQVGVWRQRLLRGFEPFPLNLKLLLAKRDLLTEVGLLRLQIQDSLLVSLHGLRKDLVLFLRDIVLQCEVNQNHVAEHVVPRPGFKGCNDLVVS